MSTKTASSSNGTTAMEALPRYERPKVDVEPTFQRVADTEIQSELDIAHEACRGVSELLMGTRLDADDDQDRLDYLAHAYVSTLMIQERITRAVGFIRDGRAPSSVRSVFGPGPGERGDLPF